MRDLLYTFYKYLGKSSYVFANIKQERKHEGLQGCFSIPFLLSGSLFSHFNLKYNKLD